MEKPLDVRVKITALDANGKRFHIAVHAGQTHSSAHQPGVLDLLKSTVDNRPLEVWIQYLITWNLDFLNTLLSDNCQIRLGRTLFEPIAQQLPSNRLPGTGHEGDLWIESLESKVWQFPWHLLAHGPNFLHAIRWSCSLTTTRAPIDVQLPPSPRVLVALQPSGRKTTQATQHLDTLENGLMQADHLFTRGRNLHVVYTWEDFKQSLIQWTPHLVYYYGAGAEPDPNSDIPAILFTEDKNNTPRPVPWKEWIRTLNILSPEKLPRLFYLNGVQGHSETATQWGFNLSHHLPAVVVGQSGHLAPDDLRENVAQHQALHFWEALLLKPNQPPHTIISHLPHLQETDHSAIRNGRWSLPVLFRHYQTWQNTPPKSNVKILDAHWFLKFDRREQYSPVAEETRQMIRNLRPRSLVYLWYGQEKQGIDLFHRRITVQLRQELEKINLLEKRPRWPDTLGSGNEPDMENQWREMILEAFGVQYLEEIPAHIRQQSGGTGGYQVLLHMRHQPLSKESVVQLPAIPIYLRWWNKQITPLLNAGAANAYGLLGISFVTQKPDNFKTLLSKHKLNEMILDNSILHILQEMGKVDLQDLIRFLQIYKIEIPDHINRLKNILSETDGEYEPTLAKLKELAEQVWDQSSENKESQERIETPLDDTDY